MNGFIRENIRGQHVLRFDAGEFADIFPQVEAAHRLLHGKSGAGSDFLGWLFLPRDYDKTEFGRIGLFDSNGR